MAEEELKRPSARIRNVAEMLEKLEDQALATGNKEAIVAVRAIGVALLMQIQEIGVELKQKIAEIQSQQEQSD